MKRFRIITAICLGIIALLVAANVHYLFGLYDSLRGQTLQTVAECARRADILEILRRLRLASPDSDDSFIRFSLVVEGEKNDGGYYDYPNILENLNHTMSEYFHVVEQSNTRMAPRDFAALDSIFRLELAEAGLHPRRAFLLTAGERCDANAGLWSVEVSVARGQILTAWLSPLIGHVLSRMAGILITSAAILALTAFLILYLLHRVRRLRTLEQMKDDFTHNMTHELKTPVAVAYAAADSMLRYYDHSDEARNRRFLGIIQERLGHLSGMIENILAMSMQRFNQLQLSPAPIALRPLVDEFAAMTKLKADKDVEISVDIPENLIVTADPAHMANVLTNLFDNAVKYSGSAVRISVRADGRSLAVADNGIGIDSTALPHIFEKFFRAGTGDRYEVGGYGLGLFYARQIVELHGWTISAESRPGKGTTFTINFNGQ